MSQPVSIGNYWEKNFFFEGHVGIFHLHRAQCQKAAGGLKKSADLFNKEKGEGYEKQDSQKSLNLSQLD